MMPDGKRQTTAVLMPGDVCSTQAIFSVPEDHSVEALSECTLAVARPQAVRDLVALHPNIARAFWWSSLAEAAIMREWLANLGQRPARQRLAHLFCEIFVRGRMVGMADQRSMPLPLVQADVAAILGLSLVHTNRSLRQLEEAGLASLKHGVLHIDDCERLQALGDFDAAYLHLDHRFAWKPSPQPIRRGDRREARTEPLRVSP